MWCLSLKAFPQYSHLNGRSPVCTGKWVISVETSGKLLPQNLHITTLLLPLPLPLPPELPALSPKGSPPPPPPPLPPISSEFPPWPPPGELGLGEAERCREASDPEPSRFGPRAAAAASSNSRGDTCPAAASSASPLPSMGLSMPGGHISEAEGEWWSCACDWCSAW